jgi:lysophospholipase L1-like esterase
MSRRSLRGCVTLFIAIIYYDAGAQISKPSYPDSLFSKYYHQKVSQFKKLPVSKGEIILLGNSITDGGEWSEVFTDSNIKNRGISGDNSIGILNRIDEIYNRKPSKVFVMIGVNDLKNGLSVDSIYKNMISIVSILKSHSPETKVFIQSILPVNDNFKQFVAHTSKATDIPLLNEKLKTNTQKYNYTFLDFYGSFVDLTGKLKSEYTNDGLHLLGKGYQHWKSLIMPHIYDLQVKPSIIPKPQHMEWNEQNFFIPTSVTLTIDDTLQVFESYVKAMFTPLGTSFNNGQRKNIVLKIGRVKTQHFENEAYELIIDNTQILLTANERHGIFNGLQTLRQLLRDGVYVPGCIVKDYPAFAWRGMMHDVGRNFQTIPFLKAQIDEMARYKLNVFHFHLTENVAWRLESKMYPELTESKFMTRNTGEYYSQEELKDLIQYCKDRYITLIPELDMPGHSEAFTRAMGVDMQSPKGVEIVRNILLEFCDTFDVPILHIGGDEVKITNPQFLPEMIALIESKNKKVMGWLPGGNLSKNTIHQLWLGNVKPPKDRPSVDSRFLYINHHDPLESVLTIFQTRICEVDKGDSISLGVITCVWPDRRVSNQEAILSQNPFYPSLLATAERSWLGGGYKPGTTLIHNLAEFTEFEDRLLDHKKLYFQNKPFPYIRQSHITWQITEAFDNNGNLEARFEPEMAGDIDKIKTRSKGINGGTIYLRHWWSPLSESFMPDSKENSTVYAFRIVWSETNKEAKMWIGFNNISRSPATNTPPKGGWDDRKSRIWINNELIAPYSFARAGQKGDSETPLIDEGYEFRSPTVVQLKKGWNQILVKLPVGSFNAEWQNPVKWMFTAVFVEEDDE